VEEGPWKKLPNCQHGEIAKAKVKDKDKDKV
jgi:hypothetical protein